MRFIALIIGIALNGFLSAQDLPQTVQTATEQGLPGQVDINTQIPLKAVYRLESLQITLPPMLGVSGRTVTLPSQAPPTVHSGAVALPPVNATAPQPASVRRYNAQWTFPGSNVKQHLAGAPHYISWDRLNAMSYDAALRLHDNLHNSTARARSGFKTPIRAFFSRGRR